MKKVWLLFTSKMNKLGFGPYDYSIYSQPYDSIADYRMYRQCNLAVTYI